MAKSGAQAQTEKPGAQKGSATKMPIFATKFDGSGSDNTDEFRSTVDAAVCCGSCTVARSDRANASGTGAEAFSAMKLRPFPARISETVRNIDRAR